MQKQNGELPVVAGELPVEESYARCERLAREHYENFPVARLVPKRLRRHVAAIYAFARVADDIADEGYAGEGATEPLTVEERLAALRAMDALVVAEADAGEANDRHSACDSGLWLFPALRDTVRRFNIPVQLLWDLTSAFAQDVTKRRYADFAEVLDYCRRSANPVGRLVLLLHGYDDAERFAQSDAICTALQLANFWQDVARDWRKDERVYLPLDDLGRHGVAVSEIGAERASAGLCACVRENVERAQALFDAGRPLAGSLAFPLSLEIRATWWGGVTVLEKIRRQGFDTLVSRPKITTWDKVRLLLRAVFAFR